MPARKEENWRFADLKKLDLEGFGVGPAFQGRDATAAVTRSVGVSPAGRTTGARE